MDDSPNDQRPPKKSRVSNDEDANNRRADPAMCLNDECMFLVLSFVGGGPGILKPNATETDVEESSRTESTTLEGEAGGGEQGEVVEESEQTGSCRCGKCKRRHCSTTGMTVLQAFTFYHSIASVSRQWRQTMDRIVALLVPLVEVDYRDLPEEMEETFTTWVCHHKFLIETLHCVSDKDQRLVPLATQILVECDTSQLVHASVRLSLTKRALFAPQLEFHRTLAQNCPKLIP